MCVCMRCCGCAALCCTGCDACIDLACMYIARVVQFSLLCLPPLFTLFSLYILALTLSHPSLNRIIDDSWTYMSQNEKGMWGWDVETLRTTTYRHIEVLADMNITMCVALVRQRSMCTARVWWMRCTVLVMLNNCACIDTTCNVCQRTCHACVVDVVACM